MEIKDKLEMNNVRINEVNFDEDMESHDQSNSYIVS